MRGRTLQVIHKAEHVLTTSRYGEWIVVFCESCKHADEELADRARKVESVWIRMKEQAQFMERIEPVMKPELRYDFKESLKVLERKLSVANANIQAVQQHEIALGPGGKKKIFQFQRWARKGKFAWEKETLDEIIADLDDWRDRFDPTWYLTMLNANPKIDEELRKAGLQASHQAHHARSASRGIDSRDGSFPPSPTRTPPPSYSSETPTPRGLQRNLSWDVPTPLALAGGIREAVRPKDSTNASVFLAEREMETLSIPYSSAKLAKFPTSRSGMSMILVKVDISNGVSKADKTEDVRDLARRLKNANPYAFGLLKCTGAIKIFHRSPERREKWLTGIDIVFETPKNTDARQMHSLRELLVKANQAGEELTLTRRVQVAKELTQAVNYVHTFDFVHKNICPESVLVVDNDDALTSRRRRSTFLVGFECFRSSDGNTVMRSDTAWERNIYRHPSRQGLNVTEKYRMQHDIYSLGVCLFEIGLCESLLIFADVPGPLKPEFGPIIQEFLEWYTKSTGRELSNAYQFHTAGPKFKVFLVEYAKTRLPKKMGERYTQVVLSCLTCLDEGNDSFGDLAGDDEEYDDEEDGSTIGFRFIKQILTKLNEIKL